jgi:hypothetical protein
MQFVLRAIALISFVVAIIWWFVSPGFEPLSAVLVGLLTLLTSFVVEKSKGESETLGERNRRVMLDHVENFWVKGILEKSLHGAALLELGIKEDPGAVHYPWTIKRESSNETMPTGKSMLEIFQEIGMGRSLLILGAPGSGKTTILLELTRQLIGRAREDKTEPIPVVFNLASWTEKQNLAGWLAEQLNIIYSVPRKIASAWVQGNKMLLLLDGLDEVREDSRAKCVQAINQFRNKYGLTSLIVCSRIEEYTAINKKLAFEGVITIQPLTSEQVSAYIDRFGNRLANLRLLLKEDKALQELAETPLMLSIMTLAYKDLQADELLAFPHIEDRRKHLFNTYIGRMFERLTRSASASYSAPFTKPETLRYLSWLAHTMIRHNIITYQLESTQPSWLAKQQLRLYRLILGISVGSLVGLSAGLGFGLFFGLGFGLLDELSAGLGFGLLGGPSAGLFFGLVGGLSAGLVFGLPVWLVAKENERISMAYKLTWSTKTALRILFIGLPTGSLIGMSTGSLFGLPTGLLFGLLVGLSAGLVFGLGSEEVEKITYPGQRLKQSLVSGLLITLMSGLFLGLIAGVVHGLLGGLGIGLSFGLFLGLGAGLFGESPGNLKSGYWPLAQHYSLRLVLARHHLLPWHLIPFLEYSARLIFLRRVGGSYIFVHRLLMQHFAEMEV